jgi:hypothetical protein
MPKNNKKSNSDPPETQTETVSSPPVEETAGEKEGQAQAQSSSSPLQTIEKAVEKEVQAIVDIERETMRKIKLWAWTFGSMCGSTILGLAVGYITGLIVACTLIGLGVGVILSTFGLLMTKTRRVKETDQAYV